MKFRFTRSSRKHKIGRAAAIEAVIDAGEPEQIGADKFLWVGTDARGRELEIVGVTAAEDPDLIIFIHVMPTSFDI